MESLLPSSFLKQLVLSKPFLPQFQEAQNSAVKISFMLTIYIVVYSSPGEQVTSECSNF